MLRWAGSASMRELLLGVFDAKTHFSTTPPLLPSPPEAGTGKGVAMVEVKCHLVLTTHRERFLVSPVIDSG